MRFGACRKFEELGPISSKNLEVTDMSDSLDRRAFLKSAAAAGAAVGLNAAVNPALLAAEGGSKPLFKISLAEWSFHRTLNDKKTMTNLDFPVVAKRDFGIDGVEYVNQFFM